jgi:hypothetical protein
VPALFAINCFTEVSRPFAPRVAAHKGRPRSPLGGEPYRRAPATLMPACALSDTRRRRHDRACRGLVAALARWTYAIIVRRSTGGSWRSSSRTLHNRTNRGPIPFSVEESALGRRMITEKSQQSSTVRRNSNCRAGRALYTFPSEHDPLGRRELPPFILHFRLSTLAFPPEHPRISA